MSKVRHPEITNAEELYEAFEKMENSPGIEDIHFSWRKDCFFLHPHPTEEDYIVSNRCFEFIDQLIHKIHYNLRFSLVYLEGKLALSLDDEELFFTVYGIRKYDLEDIIKRYGMNIEDMEEAANPRRNSYSDPWPESKFYSDCVSKSVEEILEVGTDRLKDMSFKVFEDVSATLSSFGFIGIMSEKYKDVMWFVPTSYEGDTN